MEEEKMNHDRKYVLRMLQYLVSFGAVSRQDTVEEIAEDALNLLRDLPDNVVRCKDCQFHDAGENEVDAWDRCKLHSLNTSGDEFCSWGVRKPEGR